jgi:protoporphyrinogen IX oxidase
MAYIWLKSAHLLFVMAWVAAVFYLPRLMINFAEASGQPEVQARLLLMAKRLYRFGHVMFGLAVVFGLGLVHYSGFGGWLHAKLLLVGLLFVYFILSYKRLQATQSGKALPSPRTLRWLNELPVLLLFAVIFLVIGKPF